MIPLLIECCIIILLLIIGLMLSIKSMTKGSKKKKNEPFLLTKEDILNNKRILMLSINRSEYLYGYRTESEYDKFIEDMDNSLMRL